MQLCDRRNWNMNFSIRSMKPGAVTKRKCNKACRWLLLDLPLLEWEEKSEKEKKKTDQLLHKANFMYFILQPVHHYFSALELVFQGTVRKCNRFCVLPKFESRNVASPVIRPSQSAGTKVAHILMLAFLWYDKSSWKSMGKSVVLILWDSTSLLWGSSWLSKEYTEPPPTACSLSREKQSVLP